MKNVLPLITISFAFAISLSAQNDPMIVKIRQSAAQKIDVQLANLEKKRTGISVQDVKGNTWVSEYAWNETGYHKTINMTGMPPGEYLVVINKQNTIQTQAFMLTTKHLVLFEAAKTNGEEEAIAKLVSFDNKSTTRNIITNITKESNNIIKIQLANLQGKQIVMNLHQIGNNSAMEVKVSGEQGYSKNWNLTGMPFGDYYLHLQTPEESFLYFLEFGKEGITIQSKQHLEYSRLLINEKLAVK
ncbi:MAG: hypothetical protein IPJ74_00140 [Saprospiraceae bacterium]|nr:hypothetical protein [Saprospiraceae bacterium]